MVGRTTSGTANSQQNGQLDSAGGRGTAPWAQVLQGGRSDVINAAWAALRSLATAEVSWMRGIPYQRQCFKMREQCFFLFFDRARGRALLELLLRSSGDVLKFCGILI